MRNSLVVSFCNMVPLTSPSTVVVVPAGPFERWVYFVELTEFLYSFDAFLHWRVLL